MAWPGRCSRGGGTGRHVWQLGELAHEAAIDPVLPGPDPGTGEADGAARGHGVSIAGGDQCQPFALRVESHRRLIAQAQAQVLHQRWAHAHGKHTGLLQRAVGERGHIPCGEDFGVVQRLQPVVDFDEAVFVQCQTGALQPGRPTGLRDPHRFVGIEGSTVARVQATGRDLMHLRTRMHRDVALFEHAGKARAYPGVVRRQDGVARREQHKVQPIGIAPQLLQLAAQPVLHRQHQFNPARTAADHRDRESIAQQAHALEQIQPAEVEVGDGLHGHCVCLRAFHLAHIGCGADVDGEQAHAGWTDRGPSLHHG